MKRFERNYVFGQASAPVYAGQTVHKGLQEMHDHDFVEIVLVIGGRAQHVSSGGRQPLRAGDVIILRPGAWHAYNDCENLEIYNCCFGSELLHHELAWLIEDPALGYLLWQGLLSHGRKGVLVTRLPKSSAQRCREALDLLHNTLLLSPRKSRPSLVALLLHFLGVLGEECRREIRQMAAPRREIHPSVTSGIRLLEKTPAYSWSLSELAGKLHIAPTYLVRLFREATGLPPMAYLAQCRAEWAASLLVRSDLSISEIAAQTGWDSPYYFARRFRAHFGMTASDYRSRWKGRALFGKTEASKNR